MEKEKYEPTLEEVEKAEEMAVEGEMTQEQEKMSKERETTFEAGREHGKHEIFTLEKSQFEKEKNNFERESAINKMAEELKLSNEIKEYFLKGLAEYKDGMLTPVKVTEKQLIAIIKELPVIESYDTHYSQEITITQNILDELLKHEELKKVYTSKFLKNDEERDLFRKLEDIIQDRLWKEAWKGASKIRK